MTTHRPLDLNPHIFVSTPDAAVEFYEDAFGAHELFRSRLPDGRVLFVEMAFGPAKLLLSGEVSELGAHGPSTLGESPVLLTIELDDIDAVAARATELGGEVEMPVGEMFWGERYGIIRDPFGHRWALCTRRQDLDPEEIIRRVPRDVARPAGRQRRTETASEHQHRSRRWLRGAGSGSVASQ